MMRKTESRTFRGAVAWLMVLAIQPWCCCVGPSAAHAEMDGAGVAEHCGGFGEEGSGDAHGVASPGHEAGGCGASEGEGEASGCGSPKDGVQRDCGSCECDVPAMVVRGPSERSGAALALWGADSALPGWAAPVAGGGDRFRRGFVSAICNRVLPERCSDRSLLGQGTLLTI